MRISDWSSDVCSSDLIGLCCQPAQGEFNEVRGMSLKLRERVIEMLASRPDERFKARDIASWIYKNYRAEADEKLAASKWATNKPELLNQLVAEIGANRPAWQRMHPELRTTEEIGRALCREKVCQTVYISVVAG